jgi:hypothetical protein
VIGFDGREHDVRLCNGQQMKWSEEEVRDRWTVDKYIMRRGWTAQDQKTLQSGVRLSERRRSENHEKFETQACNAVSV